MWNHRKISFCLFILIQCLLLITAASDICISLCRCANETGIEKIHCDFIENKEYTLGDGLTLPERANSINITLGINSKLYIREGLFKSRNKINSVSIQGEKNDFKSSNNYVAFNKNSLAGISGGLPEISFKNLKSVMLHELSLTDAYEIVLFVENVWKVIVEKEVFGSTSYNATFNEINDLILNEGFLRNAHTENVEQKIFSVFISRARIKEWVPMGGLLLTELKIEHSEIEIIKSKGFNTGKIGSFVLDNIKVQLIEMDVFRVGIVLQNMAVTNCKIDKIATNAIRNIGITNFSFQNNVINDIIESESIEFFGADINIKHNIINRMGEKWLKVSEASSIKIMNNTFGRFESVQLEGASNLSCDIYHNRFTEIQKDSLKLISDKCSFTELIFHHFCDCSFKKWLSEISSRTLENESYCRLKNDDPLMKCFNAETVKYEQYHEQQCSKSKARKSRLNCDKLKEIPKLDAKFVDPKVLSDDFDWMDNIQYIAIGVLLIFLLPCICMTIMCKRSSRREESYSPNTNISPQTDLLHLNQSEGPPSYEASLRSTKSFSNHDRIIIKQTLETMKQKQPEDKYEMVHNNTQRLLHEHLNEYEKVKIIGDIVQTIGECENCGEDFVAFTDILYKHLAPDTTTALRNTTASRIQHPIDDLYSEPVLPQVAREQGKTHSEHIYAEPTMLTQQQTREPLLLANNYSHPLDTNMNNINSANLYSEPILHDTVAPSTFGSFKPQVATPYAISQTIDQHQPSTSTNLPDIIYRTDQPGPSSEINRINRSPTTNRKIPEYTVPSTSHKVPIRVTQDNIEDWSDESMENSTSSNHSGGSNATVKIDELI